MFNWLKRGVWAYKSISFELASVTNSNDSYYLRHGSIGL